MDDSQKGFQASYEEFKGQMPQEDPKINVWPQKKDIEPYPTVNIITRKLWGANLPKGMIPESMPYSIVMLENDTGTDFCFNRKNCSKRARELQTKHMESGEVDLQYNFLLGEDGNVYEGRGWGVQSARTLKAITDYPYRLDVGYIGKHDSTRPNMELYCLLKTLLRYGVRQGYLTRDFSLVEVKDDLRYNKYMEKLYQSELTSYHSRYFFRILLETHKMVRVITLDTHGFLYIVPRNEWMAKEPTNYVPVTRPFSVVTISMTRTAECNSRVDCMNQLMMIQEKQIAEGNPDVRSSFYIGGYGTVYEGRGWIHQTDHSPDEQRERLDISLIGNFASNSSILRPPPYEMFASALSLIKYGIKNDFIRQDFKLSYNLPPESSEHKVNIYNI